MSRSLKAHILLVAITMIWGLTFVVIKSALADISPLLFNAIRMSLAALLLAAVFHRERSWLTFGALRYGSLVGFFLFLGNELQTCGLKYTTPSKSAFLTGVSVVLVRCSWRSSGDVASIAGAPPESAWHLSGFTGSPSLLRPGQA